MTCVIADDLEYPDMHTKEGDILTSLEIGVVR